MEVVLAADSGFCFGVRRATEYVESLAANRNGECILTYGELIHNDGYNARLRRAGVRAVDMDGARDAACSSTCEHPCTLVIRTHGITLDEERALKALEDEYPDFHVVDMTCPFVKRIHKIADEHSNETTVFLLLGSESHPEVRGIMSHVSGEKYTFSTADDLGSLLETHNFREKQIILAAQTTQNTVEWEKCQKNIEKLYTNPKKFDTICSVTENRQHGAASLSKICDAMIVIGGKDSSNTKKLWEICKQYCSDTYLITSLADLTVDLSHKNKIGISAGASTPSDIIMEVYKAMNNETLNGSFEEMLEGSLKTLHTGETVHGIVTEVSDTELYVDLGTKVTGVVAFEQVTDDASAKLKEMYKVGDEVTVFVIRVNDREGVANLSIKRVNAGKAWDSLVAASESAEVLEGKIVEAVKGGVIVLLSGNRVFIPASHTGLPKDADLTTLVGTTQKVKIIDVDNQKKRALASIRVVLNEERRARENAFWSEIEVGKHYMGKVKNMTSYGAFVDLGGVDGMVHNTELSWKRIKSPAEVVSVGQEIDVFVKEFDAEKKRISLGYKTQEMDTWYQFVTKHSVGDVVSAKIVSMMPFGAFAEVYDGVDGLIHISQIANKKIGKPSDVLELGQVVDVKVIDIDDENRKLSLSIRALLEEEPAEEAVEASEEAEKEEVDPEMAKYIVGSVD